MSDEERVRVFVPLPFSALRALDRDGSLPAGTAHAVTAALRAAMPAADEEDLEYAALCDAADAAPGARDSSDAGGGGRRVVAAADVPAGSVAEPAVGEPPVGGAQAAGDPPVESLVTFSGPLLLVDVVSLHVGEPGAAVDEELSWYDVSELAVLLDLP